jgi:predicted secreted hydrolase
VISAYRTRCAALAFAVAVTHAPATGGAPDSWVPALPGYRYSFPSDYGAHESARNEWWYYTGNVRDARGRRFGFELTVFRFGVQHPMRDGSGWDINDLYFAHLALTDVNGKHFTSFDRVGRAALGDAGASTGHERAWVGNWRVQRRATGEHMVFAALPAYGLDLRLIPEKRATINGHNGISRKGKCASCASHYYSFTRLRAGGVLRIAGRRYDVKGAAWGDHEWGSNELGPGVVGWDWFSIQLDGGTDIMLYRLRRGDGATVPESSGTLVRPNGASHYIPRSDFSIAATGVWESTHDGTRYPSGWLVALPRERARLSVTPLLDDQEFIATKSSRVAYWEGACDVRGTLDGKQVRGVGYTELTGYAPGGLPNL